MLDDIYNNASGWVPRMRPPLSFSADDVVRYQKIIDSRIGTTRGKSIIKLAWAPSELRWRPHKLIDNPTGYTFPIFIYGYDKNGDEVAAPRYVLLERAEPEQYEPTWEAQRYMSIKGVPWDAKGPCPSERYTELWRHCLHDGNCCPCRGVECSCDKDCWGLYAEPNDDLLERIGRWREITKDDSDVQPTRDGRYFEAPNAQRELRSKLSAQEENEKTQRRQMQEDDRRYIEASPVSFLPPGMSTTKSGLIVSSDLL
jgi:hypothetical protein